MSLEAQEKVSQYVQDFSSSFIRVKIPVERKLEIEKKSTCKNKILCGIIINKQTLCFTKLDKRKQCKNWANSVSTSRQVEKVFAILI